MCLCASVPVCLCCLVLCACMCADLRACVCVCPCVFVRVCACVCVGACARMCACVRVCACVHDTYTLYLCPDASPRFMDAASEDRDTSIDGTAAVEFACDDNARRRRR